MNIVGIIVAMEKEMALLKEKIVHIVEKEIMSQLFYIGEFATKKIIFTTAGIGKVNAAVTTVLMIEHFKVDLIINSGIAGGYASFLKPLDMIVANKVVYSDVDMTSPVIGCLPYGQMEGSPTYFLPSFSLCKIGNIHFGTILSGDQFVDNYDKTAQLVNKHFSNYDIIAVDMESASIAHVCTKYQIDFLIIRSISDIIGQSNGIDYNHFSHLASNQSCDIVLEIIKSL